VPYGSLDEPEVLLSSDTRSDSSLYAFNESPSQPSRPSHNRQTQSCS
jgi:hypothetical protein